MGLVQAETMERLLRAWSTMIIADPSLQDDGLPPRLLKKAIVFEHIASSVQRPPGTRGQKHKDGGDTYHVRTVRERWQAGRIDLAAAGALVDAACHHLEVADLSRPEVRVAADHLAEALAPIEVAVERAKHGIDTQQLLRDLDETITAARGASGERSSPEVVASTIETFARNVEGVRNFCRQSLIDLSEARRRVRVYAMDAEMILMPTIAESGLRMRMINASIDAVSADVWLTYPLKGLLNSAARLLRERRIEAARRILVVKSPSTYTPKQADNVLATICANLACGVSVGLIHVDDARKIDRGAIMTNLAHFGDFVSFSATPKLTAWRIRSAAKGAAREVRRFARYERHCLPLGRSFQFFCPGAHGESRVREIMRGLGFILEP